MHTQILTHAHTQQVSSLCIGEYPTNITVTILDIDNVIQDISNVPLQVNDQLMISGTVTVPNNLDTFIINVSVSSNGGEFLPPPSFVFGKIYIFRSHSLHVRFSWTGY